MSTDPLFIRDLSVLFRDGNWMRFSLASKNEQANTLAKLLIYVSLGLAAYWNKCDYVLYGIVLLGAIGIFFSLNNPKIPLNMYYRPKPTRLRQAYSNVNPQGARQANMSEFRNALLNNVRERVIYQGEDIEIPRGSDYMQGGTRPLAPSVTDALRNNKFFQNVNNQVWFEPAVPFRYF